MVLEELLIRHLPSEVDLLSETHKLGARVTAQPLAAVLVSRPRISVLVSLGVRVRDVEVTVVG